MTLISMAVLLFFVLDPIGNIPIFLSALRSVPEERRRAIILRECGLAYALLVLFILVGKPFLALLHLSSVSLGIAGGVVLFLIALKMIFPTKEPIFGVHAEGEPLLFPLAVPTVAGPSAMATVLLLVSANPAGFWGCLGALTVAMGCSTVLLLFSGKIARVAGERVMVAAERLMGLILTAIAVEMLLGGVREFVRSLG